MPPGEYDCTTCVRITDGHCSVYVNNALRCCGCSGVSVRCHAPAFVPWECSGSTAAMQMFPAIQYLSAKKRRCMHQFEDQRH